MAKKWIQAATAKMKKKGTLGSFGPATTKKIAAAKKKGGKMEKKAIFAQNMKKIANKNAPKKAKGKLNPGLARYLAKKKNQSVQSMPIDQSPMVGVMPSMAPNDYIKNQKMLRKKMKGKGMA